MIDLQCYTKAKPSIYSEFDPNAQYSVYYTGTKLDQGKSPSLLAHDNGIAIEPEWVRSFVKTSDKKMKPDQGGFSFGRTGWYLRVWVPVPLRLFVKRETRTFVLKACVWIRSGENNVVEASHEVTVSHLRKEREMT